MYHLNFNSPVPLYEQLERQTQFLIASDVLPEGVMIPSVRDAAKSLAVNPQTIVRAYANLKNAGLIQSVRGQGFVVAVGARARCRDLRLQLFQSRVEESLEEAVLGRMTPDEISTILKRSFQRIVDKYFPNSTSDLPAETR